MSGRYVVIQKGKKQIGKPTKDFKAALQRAYDTAAAYDLKRLSPKQISALCYDVVEI